MTSPLQPIDDALAAQLDDESVEPPVPSLALALHQIEDAIATLNDLIDETLPTMRRAAVDAHRAEWCTAEGLAAQTWASAVHCRSALLDLDATRPRVTEQDWRTLGGYM